MRILRYKSLASTNSEATRLAGELHDGDVVVTRCQTVGRGQRGNSWEAEPDKNLTFSVFFKPENLRAADSFRLSMAVSLAIADVVGAELNSDEIKIKWPNDIYWRNKKIAGILIENAFSGPMVSHSIVGVGLNVNQAEFRSDAPNPVSMVQIAGNEFDLDNLLETIVGAMLVFVGSLMPYGELEEKYHEKLWLNDGPHMWYEPGGEPFQASIHDVAPSGHLTLIDERGVKRTYAFKEVFPVLPE